MTATIQIEPAVTYARPSYEGANIRTWIGFKHFIYLVEQAVLEWLLEQGSGARQLFLEHGLGVEIVDCSVHLPAVLEIDDRVRAQVSTGKDRRLVVQLSVVRDGGEVTVLRGKVDLVLVREPAATVHRPAPPALAGREVPDLAAASPVAAAPLVVPPGGTARSVLAGQPAGYLWSWRARYFYCHFSDRVQHSGFVRALEEVVDRFLADRGISVGRMLAERQWIPVVSRARVQLLSAAQLEETVHTVFTVVDILRGVMFDARMDCYVQRADQLVPVATGRILHGYAIAAGVDAGRLAQLDPDLIRALLAGGGA